MHQQRLVGSIVLLCILIVIVLFLITHARQAVQTLPQTKQEQLDHADSVAPLPEGDRDDVIAATAHLPPTVGPQHDVKAQNASLPSVEKKLNQVRNREKEPGQRVTHSLNTQSEDAHRPTWIIQVASFSVEKNARQLQQRIAQHGYTVIVSPVVRKGKMIYRLRTAPIDDKHRAQNLAEKIRAITGSQPQLLRH